MICTVHINESCGLHIHISSPPQSRGKWSIQTLRSVCRSILYFNEAIEALVPAERRSNIYSANNHHENTLLKGRTMKTSIDMVNRCRDPTGIADLMNDGGERYFSWNFVNLYYGGKATVEFRQVPAAADEKSSIPWIELVASFMNSSKLTSPYGELLRYNRDVNGLWKFLTRHELPGFKPTLMASIFKGKSGSILPKPVRDLTGQELEKMRKEMDRNVMMKKYDLKPTWKISS